MRYIIIILCWIKKNNNKKPSACAKSERGRLAYCRPGQRWHGANNTRFPIFDDGGVLGIFGFFFFVFIRLTLRVVENTTVSYFRHVLLRSIIIRKNLNTTTHHRCIVSGVKRPNSLYDTIIETIRSASGLRAIFKIDN